MTEKASGSFLTERQLEILELRSKWHTQEEIARKLGTTRENVTITEKRARDNIKKARRTIDAFEMLSPVEIEIEKGDDVFQVPDKILRMGDTSGIDILYNKTTLVSMLRRKAGDRIGGNKILDGFKVLLLRNGKIRL